MTKDGWRLDSVACLVGLGIVLLAGVGPVAADEPPPTASAPAAAISESVPALPVVTTAPAPVVAEKSEYERCAFAEPETPALTLRAAREPWWPELGWPTLAWFGAVGVLALTFRPRKLLCIRNVDALVLAGMCILLALRDAPTSGGDDWPGRAYLWLTVAAAYWLVRGVFLLMCRRMTQPGDMPSQGTVIVLLAAGLALGIHQIATAPLSIGSHDGLVGGLFYKATGKLPYGDADWVARQSPLLYVIHAGAVSVVPPEGPFGPEHQVRAMTWDNREAWLHQPWLGTADLAAARLANGVLFLLLVLGVHLLGRALQSPTAGAMMAAALCLFPGTLECVTRPEALLPAVLITWAVVLSLLRGVGGLLGMFTLTLAGVAWPWAWLAGPVLLAHFFRRGWQALGGLVGLGCGVAVLVLGLADLVQPALVRPGGALQLAGLRPMYKAHLVDGSTVVLDTLAADEQGGSEALTAPLWRRLVQADAVLLNGKEHFTADLPNSVRREDLLYRRIAPTDEARPLLRDSYREALAAAPATTRLIAAARTVLEATWAPRYPAELPTDAAWAVWNGPGEPQTWLLRLRRATKVAAGLVAVWATLAMFFGRRGRPRHLLAGVLAVLAATLLASAHGAVTNLVWLLPAVLAIWALPEEAAPAPARGAPPVARTMPPAPGVSEAPPRITIEH